VNPWPAGDIERDLDDLRLVGLKLIFLIGFRAVSLLGLSRREAWWKDAEILMLRHQLAPTTSCRSQVFRLTELNLGSVSTICR